ncbi:hypothetical protein DL767_007332 [Monosporascus sp. MG133]|nr:hypothetical protein DL767_007332 [Monosporascus sp. MG133]
MAQPLRVARLGVGELNAAPELPCILKVAVHEGELAPVVVAAIAGTEAAGLKSAFCPSFKISSLTYGTYRGIILPHDDVKRRARRDGLVDAAQQASLAVVHGRIDPVQGAPAPPSRVPVNGYSAQEESQFE